MDYRLACLAAVCVLTSARAAQADFFDDARKTFTRDIPHFFQDDIPCTFGGQPTSGARQSCRQAKPAPRRPPSSSPPVRATPEKPVRR